MINSVQFSQTKKTGEPICVGAARRKHRHIHCEVSKHFLSGQYGTYRLLKDWQVNRQGSFTVIPALESSTHRSCMGVIQTNSYYIDITRLLTLGVG
ncbi:hypothetical protein [Nostoc sp. PCC 9305]|uniref:hypothetical protein n=1 Tax=Nostoc sp. PCC 9305 TaxID=296636 RepID=UPI0039C5CA74